MDQQPTYFTPAAPGRRALVAWLACLAVLSAACAAGGPHAGQAELTPEDRALRQKFRGIQGGVLYLDATGSSKTYVMIETHDGRVWQVPRNVVSGSGARQSTFTDALYIPAAIRVTWRTGEVRERLNPFGRPSGDQFGFEGGTVLGDYTVALASRIPDEVLDYIRTRGGALRVKIRLNDDGVAIGWDVEERVPKPNWQPSSGARNFIQYSMAGGDFH